MKRKSEEGVASAFQKGLSSGVGSCDTRVSFRTLFMSAKTECTTFKIIIWRYLYKLKYVRGLFTWSLLKREIFPFQFPVIMEEHNACPYTILWTDEDHFLLQKAANRDNCLIWAIELPHTSQTSLFPKNDYILRVYCRLCFWLVLF